jgi:hypothetical protein
MTRLRNVIVELNTKKAFPNELKASQFFGISRYYIRKSMAKSVLVKGYAFSPYHFGMDFDRRLRSYR